MDNRPSITRSTNQRRYQSHFAIQESFWETNLNTAPYFDDFDPQNNYYKVYSNQDILFRQKLTTLQSILQDQIEKFGNHVFKEGDSVTGGGVRYNNSLNCSY